MFVLAIMVMFDSLNRRMLTPYGCDWVKTPNFQRLAARAATFDHAYVGSMPCMPARRELHTWAAAYRGRPFVEIARQPMDEARRQAGQGGLKNVLGFLTGRKAESPPAPTDEEIESLARGARGVVGQMVDDAVQTVPDIVR
jgi:hypothetical protein